MTLPHRSEFPAPKELLRSGVEVPGESLPQGSGSAGALPWCARLRAAGFSLVEVAVSMGVLSIACVSLLGMLANCFDQFRMVIDRSCVSAISTNLVNQAQQTDLAALQAAGPSVSYFDEQAREVPSPQGAIYRARLEVTASAPHPLGNPANPFLNRITVQVASNHGRPPATAPGGGWLDSPAQRVFTEVALLGAGH